MDEERSAGKTALLFAFSAFRQLSRAKQATTRCAGGEKRLYKKTHRSVTIKVFRPIVQRKVS